MQQHRREGEEPSNDDDSDEEPSDDKSDNSDLQAHVPIPQVHNIKAMGSLS